MTYRRLQGANCSELIIHVSGPDGVTDLPAAAMTLGDSLFKLAYEALSGNALLRLYQRLVRYYVFGDAYPAPGEGSKLCADCPEQDRT